MVVCCFFLPIPKAAPAAAATAAAAAAAAAATSNYERKIDPPVATKEGGLMVRKTKSMLYEIGLEMDVACTGVILDVYGYSSLVYSFRFRVYDSWSMLDS
jgi:hypothetical protein